MALPGSAAQVQSTRYKPRSWTFRDHTFKAQVRGVANMDEEAGILAAGMSAETKRIEHHTKLLQAYCRTCVREVRIQAPGEDPADVKPVTGHELAQAIEDTLSKDADYCWSLYINLGAADVANIGNRASLVEAVQGKPGGSSTTGTQTPIQSQKPSCCEPFSDEEE